MPSASERLQKTAGQAIAPAARDLSSRPPAARLMTGLAAALSAATPSMDALRDAAVRYGSAARALAIGPDEMAGALSAILRRCIARHAPALRAELETSVPWWAIHGYHRAD